MEHHRNTQSAGDPASNRPYAMIGAGRLAASVWKTGDENAGWHYRFNVFRMSKANGRLTQRFSPRDVADLVKLVQVLAFTLADDGCLDDRLRNELHRLAEKLDEIVPMQEIRPDAHGEGHG